ncbi:MAG: ASKHA domain-containing protein [Promethearchaeota archaeon]
MPKIIFEPISKRVSVPRGETIYTAVQKLGHALSTVCGGAGTCGKCKVVIAGNSDNLTPATEVERRLLSEEELAEGYRLACQSRVNGDVRVVIPPESLEKKGRILEGGKRVEVPLEPRTRKVHVHVTAPSLDAVVGDVERFFEALPNLEIELTPRVYRDLPAAIRRGGGEVTATLLGRRGGTSKNSPGVGVELVLAVQPGNTVDQHYGLAVDVGTTTVVGYLLDMKTGGVVATSSTLNPQVAFGEDVITRITRAKKEKDLRRLNRVILDCVTHLCEDACIQAGVPIESVHEVHVVGNTAMHHLFLGLPTDSLGMSPFTPVVQHSTDFTGEAIGLTNLERANVHTLPVIAGFVGADTVGVILAGNLEALEPLTLTIDIGTNGELVLGNREEGLVAGSCAAGSALEGAHVSSGMRAAGGAIEKVKVDPETLEVTYSTINDEAPVGLCGSGILDITAELVRARVITRSGKFNRDKEIVGNPRVVDGDAGPEFVVATASESTSGKPITFTQEDVRELQKAKAAFYTGAKLLLQEAGKGVGDLQQVLLAGAFGSYLDPENLHFIGMIPDLPLNSITQIGNAAGVGSQYSLLNSEYAAKAERVARETGYIELTTKPAFAREYAYAMYFPHYNVSADFPSLAGAYEDIPKR